MARIAALSGTGSLGHAETMEASSAKACEAICEGAAALPL
jgi:hypothetical protein